MNEVCCQEPLTRAGKANARREKVILAARAAFAEHGFHAAGIALIAQKSGVPVGQLYRDFANKEAIVAEIVERDLDAFMSARELSELAAAADPSAARAWLARFVACENIANARLGAEIMAEASRNGRIAEIFLAIDARVRRAVCEVVRLLIPAKASNAQVECLTDVVLTIAGGVFRRRQIEPDQPDIAVVDALVQCVEMTIARVSAEIEATAAPA